MKRGYVTVPLCDTAGCMNRNKYLRGNDRFCERHYPDRYLSGVDLFAFARGAIPYCGETCPGVDTCRHRDTDRHGVLP